MKKTINIMLVDDHALMRSGLKLLLQKRPSLKVVGEASDGLEALRLYDILRPDILILDISLPRLDGIQVLTEIKLRYEQAKVIVLTMHEDEDYITLIMNAGASGYVPKAAVDEELYTAIDSVMDGYLYLRPKEISTMLKRLQNETESRNPYVILSPREREVLQFLVKGFSLSEIAQELTISIKTVDTHKTRMLNKLNLSKKSELVQYAIKYNLINMI
ncbi:MULTISPECIES: response regulator [Bacillus]|uniref:DNA-binding response regulator n=1 Tax=Bacillus pseudomycoides TaxID=64104 RepID=A0AAJ3V4J3_9BACI|nr:MULTISPECIES: response regulator transcription factor [Bacillus cereus group]MBD5797969.1 DNA-binding response regulator [Bacillus pseudomycoides]MBJ8026886.1 response regulator transcription factor [Bacillus cereus group sp. N21]MCR8860487.1 response regulator transcription factor [Bacillus pseudomycoides]MDR4187944.1 response regulator transcription factor [Bacillus pseudomycoides]MDR4327797.1 response regulator transcription factor [Bacillus pseudomycoides]